MHLGSLLAIGLAASGWTSWPQLTPRAAHRRAWTPLAAADDGGGALAKAGGSQFEEALGALPVGERYNTVMEGLLARGRASPENTEKAFDLLAEMSSKRIVLSFTGLKALIDATARTDRIPTLLKALTAARKNGACRAFGAPTFALDRPPSGRDAASLAELPSDERVREVALATTFSGVVGVLLLVELADTFDFILPGEIYAPPLPLVLIGLAATWGYDRYTQRGEFGDAISRGLSRVFERDLQREVTVESASFLVGYVLGLPCMAFMPTAVRPIDLLAECAGEMGDVLPAPARLVDRMLIWSCAPAAAEQLVYSESVQSDPKLAARLLGAARRREATLGVDVAQGGWPADADADADDTRVRWAYGQARAQQTDVVAKPAWRITYAWGSLPMTPSTWQAVKILKRYSGVREALAEQMALGVSVGDSVQLIEDQLKNSWGRV